MNHALEQFLDEESIGSVKMKNLQRYPLKPPRMALKPNYRADESQRPDDGLNAARGILGVCGAMLVIFVVLFLLIWA